MSRFVGSAVAVLSFIVLGAHPLRAEPHESFTEPFRKIDLAPAETGLVAEIFVREGDQVKTGQILASLDKDVLTISRDMAQAAAAAEGRSKSIAADLRLKEARLRKIRELRANGHASQDELLRAEAEVEAAQGQKRSVEEQHQLDLMELKKTEAMIERRLIRSPIDGVVTKLHREQGEFVTPVAPNVVTVVQLHPLRAIFNLPRAAGATLKSGASVQVQIAESTEPFVTGAIEYIAPIIDAESETIRVKVLIDNSRGQWTAGSRCTLSVGDDTDPSIAQQ